MHEGSIRDVSQTQRKYDGEVQLSSGRSREDYQRHQNWQNEPEEQGARGCAATEAREAEEAWSLLRGICESAECGAESIMSHDVHILRDSIKVLESLAEVPNGNFHDMASFARNIGFICKQHICNYEYAGMLALNIAASAIRGKAPRAGLVREDHEIAEDYNTTMEWLSATCQSQSDHASFFTQIAGDIKRQLGDASPNAKYGEISIPLAQFSNEITDISA